MSTINRYSRSRGISNPLDASAKQTKPPRPAKRVVTADEAYAHALRAAYLAYLLQPRQKKRQHVPAPAVQKSASSAMDLLTDFSHHSGRGDHRGNQFPSAFMAALEARLTLVVTGREKLPEYNNDQLIKRTFGAFLNEFMNPVKRKSLERDRKMEELFVIFLGASVRKLQESKAPGDDSWKLMSDRHLALFIRLIRSIMDDHDWARDRPELMNRLQTFEKKLLTHDVDLAIASSQNGASSGHTIEVEVPLTYEVKDMPLVLAVSRIFGKSYGEIQDEIHQRKVIWTEEAALKDLKLYQQCISLKTKATINSDDFDTYEAYEVWKKHEINEVSQLIFAVLQINPQLAKSSTASSLPQLQNIPNTDESTFAEISRKLAENPNEINPIGSDPAFHFSSLNLEDSSNSGELEVVFTYIPPDPRLFYRAVVKETIMSDLRERDSENADDTRLISKRSLDLLTELAFRWRIPVFSRRILLLDAIKELYTDRDIGLETLSRAFMQAKEFAEDKKKINRRSATADNIVSDWTKWTLKDLTTYQQCLATIHDLILNTLFQILQNAYQSKEPIYQPFMHFLSDHIYDDALFPKSADNLDGYGEKLSRALAETAREIYGLLSQKCLTKPIEQLELFDVIQLGKKIVSYAKKVEKRFQENPFILGANPTMIFVETVFPPFAKQAEQLVGQIVGNSQDPLAVQDGFDTYREFSEIRQYYRSILPGQPFDFHVEKFLQSFVWQWLESTEQSIPEWIDGAVKHDQFNRLTGPETGQFEQRHSISVLDIFKSFGEIQNQLVGLEWNDDYQDAKFLTKMSKAFCAGVARYCELLEQRFTREMDRLTPEQEVLLNQTQQERWMQMAKNAFAGKEKIEPFNFYPESFVKLNNIEYTMQQLDRIQYEIRADRCADIIRRYEKMHEARSGSLIKRQSKLERFVFTIKIVEAEDLKAFDLNGFSDPYVVLVDEFQRRIHKTRINFQDLNPRWDETVDITTVGSINIVATIWDWDRLGDHNCVGRASLKLDPNLYKDFLPRDHWIDLDTQGRLLLRVSIEGERDDIEFHYGKAFRTLKRTEKDMTRKITDKLSAYIKYILSRDRLKNLHSKGITDTVSKAFSNYFGRSKSYQVSTSNQTIPDAEIENAITPLTDYFDDNFAIMKETLTDAAMEKVSERLWKEVLLTLEALLVPPMSDKPSAQKPLNQLELDIVFKWLKLLFDFFHAVDPETGIAHGIDINILKSPKYHDLRNLQFFYFNDSDDLIHTSEQIASQLANRQQQHISSTALTNRLSTQLAPPPVANLAGLPLQRRKTVMLSRNLGTMRQVKEEKRKAAQAEPSDEYILRILRMRPEAEKYLRDRERQKQRLAVAQAAQAIVQASLKGVR